MINKSELQSIISKYFLGGLNEAVRWEVSDKKLNISFKSPNKEMIGKICHKNFPLNNCEIGITDTSKLNKLLAVTTGLIELKLDSINKVFTKLSFSDTNYTLHYPLGDILLNQFKKLNEPTDNFTFEINCDLTKEIVDNIIRAKSALDSDNVIFNVGRNFDGEAVLELIFGDNSEHSNKINYIIQDVSLSNGTMDFVIPFNSDILKTILSNNKDFETAHMSLNTQGLLKLQFENENIESTYFLVRKADL
jgi:hypothetical protein